MRHSERSSGAGTAAGTQHAGFLERAAVPGGGGRTEPRARAALALPILAAACELGLLANGLLRVHWGVNLALWVGALVGALLWLAHSRGRVSGDTPLLLGLVAVFFAAGLAVRDAEVLSVFNVFATLSALVLLGMAVLGGPSPSVVTARVRDYVHGTVLLGWRTAFNGFPLLLRDTRVHGMNFTSRARMAMAVLRGALLALPLLIVFGGLFMAADAAFNDLVVRLLGFDFETIGSHAAVIIIFAWISAGYLHGTLVESVPAPAGNFDEFSIGPVEAASVLVLLDLLFAGFIAVQARYLFGGGTIVAETVGLTYAEYARRGFFELAFAAALVIPVLLSINFLMRRPTSRDERMFRWLAGILTVLVGLVMLSAAHRMKLYQDAYGMTESRLYASAFMIWIALVLVWFARTVLRGAGERFAIGAVVAGWLVLGGLNIANPDRLVASANLERANEGKPFDVAYAGRLGADAVPVVLQAMRTMDPNALQWGGVLESDPMIGNMNRCHLRDRLMTWVDGSSTDWRSWNLGRARARQAAERHRDLIESIDCEEPAVTRPASAPAGAVAPPPPTAAGVEPLSAGQPPSTPASVSAAPGVR